MRYKKSRAAIRTFHNVEHRAAFASIRATNHFYNIFIGDGLLLRVEGTTPRRHGISRGAVGEYRGAVGDYDDDVE